MDTSTDGCKRLFQWTHAQTTSAEAATATSAVSSPIDTGLVTRYVTSLYNYRCRCCCCFCCHWTADCRTALRPQIHNHNVRLKVDQNNNDNTTNKQCYCHLSPTIQFDINIMSLRTRGVGRTRRWSFINTSNSRHSLNAVNGDRGRLKITLLTKCRIIIGAKRCDDRLSPSVGE